ncbi:GyrI-like domain-containing protein [Mucilaginibacter sp. CSA2-8R]|uniref:AraC family transcriptional regulator n=1 Tax=Mucilaginibacter sp. CSA2-8R TaxID=3141542 RepID=UPI00315C6663
MHLANEVYRARINKVIDFIQAHIHEPVSLAQLADVACYSPFHFHRVFTSVTGETVNQFTTRARCEKAARLLRFSKKTISDIALACGYSSAATLTRAFTGYFQVSPGAYRKGEALQNSKIGKDLLAVHVYHCNREFEVSIRRLPERRVAYIRVTNAFKEGVVLDAFSALVAWAKANGVYEAQTIFGMSPDDPEVTPKGKYRYDACITLPAAFKPAHGAPISTTTLPACTYAVVRVLGNLQLVGQAFNYLFDRWLINSDYECDTQPGIEEYLNKTLIGRWDYFELDLMIPVKRLT